MRQRTMGPEQKARLSVDTRNCFHCLPVEDLPEFNEINKLQYGPQSGPKTLIERFLVEDAGFFPNKLITPRTIVEANDVKKIQHLLEEGIRQHYSMGIRTISDGWTFHGNKLPWEMEIDSPEKIAKFFTATLPLWKDYYKTNGLTINQLILMKNLPEIGTKHSNENQFVARLTWNDMRYSQEEKPDQLILEMVSGTNQLRGLDVCLEDEQVHREEIFRYIATFSAAKFLQGGTVTMGTNYFVESHMTPQTYPIEQQFALPDFVRTMVQPDRLAYVDTLFTFLHNATFDPTTKLLDRLDFLAKNGLNSIEIQGYAKKQDKNYARIYGLRGPKDETETGLQPDTQNIEEVSFKIPTT